MHAISRRRATFMSIGVLVLAASASVVQLGISTNAYAQATTPSTGSSGAASTPAFRPQLRAGTKINIQGAGGPFSGKYLVPRTTHTFGDGGSSRRKR
jgi:hypothetical protein